MRTAVLDSGALIAFQKSPKRLRDFISVSSRLGNQIILPSIVLAEVWREPPGPGMSRLLSSLDEVDVLDINRAQAIGALLGRSGHRQIVDASVAMTCWLNRPSIAITSDPDDLESLLGTLGARVQRRTGGHNIDVVIETI